MTRTMLKGLAGLLCLTWGAVSLVGCGPQPDAHAVEPAENVSRDANRALTSVRVQSLQRGAATDYSLLPADIRPWRQATVAAEIPGTLETVPVREGQTVRAGQVLATIDLRSLKQRLKEAEAVATQRQTYFERAVKLRERQAITEVQFLDAITARDVAEAQLSSARLEVEKATIKAPWSGVVAHKHVEQGDYAQPGQPLFQLLDVRRLKVRAPAPSKDVPVLELGATAQVTVETYPGEVFEGEIVHLAAALDATARTLDVDVAVDSQDGRLRPGMYAQVRLQRRHWEDALLLPLNALVDLGDGQQAVYLFQSEAKDAATHRGVVQRRVPTLGPVLGHNVVVTAGLEVGDQVLIEGQHQVADGQAVRLAEPAAASNGGAGGGA